MEKDFFRAYARDYLDPMQAWRKRGNAPYHAHHDRTRMRLDLRLKAHRV